MKKYLIASTLLLGSFLIPSSIVANESKSLYLSIGGGLNFPSDVEGDFEEVDFSFETDDPFIYSVAIGKEFNDWRLEFNYTGTTISSDSLTGTVGGTGVVLPFTPDLEFKAKSYMVYGYKDISNESKFTPYFGAGLGVSDVGYEAITVTVAGLTETLNAASKTVFSYGLKGGVGYKIADNASLYTEGSYINYASFTTELQENYDSNNSFALSAGLRFNF